MDDISMSDSLPTLELLDRLKAVLVSSGMEKDDVDHLDPVLITVNIKYMQQLEMMKKRIVEVTEKSTKLEFDNNRLRSQRDALRIALAKERVLRKQGKPEGAKPSDRDLKAEYESFFGGSGRKAE